MKREAIIELFVKKLKINHATAETLFNAIFSEIKTSLLLGQRVSIPGFGTFSMKRRAARQSRNPRTGEIIRTPARNTADFSPASALKKIVNKKYASKKPVEIKYESPKVEAAMIAPPVTQSATETAEEDLVLGAPPKEPQLPKENDIIFIEEKPHSETIEERVYSVTEKEADMSPVTEEKPVEQTEKKTDVSTFTLQEVKTLMDKQRMWFIIVAAAVVVLGVVGVLVVKSSIEKSMDARMASVAQDAVEPTERRMSSIEMSVTQASQQIQQTAQVVSQQPTQESIEAMIAQKVREEVASRGSARYSIRVREYIVKRGDSLWNISARYLRNPYAWVGLYNANGSKISDPDKIYPGQRIFIPELIER